VARPGSSRKTVFAIIGVFLSRSLAMVLATVISVLMGNKFGVGQATDSFFFARRIAMGCAEAAQRVTNIVLIPGLAAKLNSRDPELIGRTWVRYLRNTFLWGFPITIVLAVAAPFLVKIMGPGFTPDTADMSVYLLRILLFIIPVTVLESISGSVLNAGRHFTAAATIPLLGRLCVVVSLFFLVPPWNVHELAWVMLIGSAAASVILGLVAHRKLPGMVEAGEKIDSKTKGEAGRLFWPGFLVFFTTQAFIWLEFGYASTLGAGAISEMEYGYRILAILPGVVSSSLTTVMYTEFSHLMAQGRKEEMYLSLARVTRGGLYLMAPVIGFLAFQGENIARIMLHHGAFPESSIKVIGDVMLYMAFSAIGLYCVKIYIFGMYADESAPVLKMVLIMLGVTLATRIIFINLFIDSMGPAGIALARSVSTLFRVAAVYLLLKHYWGRFLRPRDLVAMLSMIVFTAVAMGATRFANDWLGFTPDKSVPVRLVGLGVMAVLGFGLYVGLTYLVRMPETARIEKAFRKKILRMG